MTILVLTGSIEARTPHTRVDDPEYRASEYAEALRFYLRSTPWPIRFVENSGFPMEADQELKAVLEDERISVDQESRVEDPERGKGFEEFRRLDEAVERLRREGYGRMVKVTGRYRVKNIRSLVPEGQDHPLIDRHPRIKSGIAISSVFVCSIPFYLEQLKGLYKQVNEKEGVTIEKVLFRKCEELPEREEPRLLPREPVIAGISGTWGNPLGRNPYRLKLRSLYRALLRLGGYKKIPREL